MRFQIAAFVANLRYCTKDTYFLIVLNTVRHGTWGVPLTITDYFYDRFSLLYLLSVL
jgi:hypothetical protein